MKLTWEKVNEWKDSADELLRDEGHTLTAEFLAALCEDWLEMYPVCEDWLEVYPLRCNRCQRRMLNENGICQNCAPRLQLQPGGKARRGI